MQSQSQSQSITPLPRGDATPSVLVERRPAWRPALALLRVRGWTVSDVLTGVAALDALDAPRATKTPHQLALLLYRRARDAGLLASGLGTSRWAVRVGILINADAEMQALLTIADALSSGDAEVARVVRTETEWGRAARYPRAT